MGMAEAEAIYISVILDTLGIFDEKEKVPPGK